MVNIRSMEKRTAHYNLKEIQVQMAEVAGLRLTSLRPPWVA